MANIHRRRGTRSNQSLYAPKKSKVHTECDLCGTVVTHAGLTLHRGKKKCLYTKEHNELKDQQYVAKTIRDKHNRLTHVASAAHNAGILIQSKAYPRKGFYPLWLEHMRIHCLIELKCPASKDLKDGFSLLVKSFQEQHQSEEQQQLLQLYYATNTLRKIVKEYAVKHHQRTYTDDYDTKHT